LEVQIWFLLFQDHRKVWNLELWGYIVIDHEIQKPDVQEILVVAVNPATLELLSGILSDRGYHVRQAPSGRLALQSTATKVPDLILLHVKMPDMDDY
jgi:response regulator RpfG family c-di-GMP phosphodiesterase